MPLPVLFTDCIKGLLITFCFQKLILDLWASKKPKVFAAIFVYLFQALTLSEKKQTFFTDHISLTICI